MGLNSLAGLGMRSTSDQVSIDAITLFVALLCACIVIGHLLEEYRWMNESITALFIGLCTGIVLLLTTGGKISLILLFNEELFFIYLLPPIIFNAGCRNISVLLLYLGKILCSVIPMMLQALLKAWLKWFQVKKKQFFRNFMTIILFGAIGTLISFGIISLGAIQLFKKLDIGFLEIGDYLAIGAIFSATDSVCTLQYRYLLKAVLNQDETPLLYSLVFGKIGLLSAYIMKKLYFGRHSTDREVALMIVMAYLSYIMAELFYLSGILTVFFCGIVMSHYTWHNVTESSRVTTKHTFATLSFVSEIFIFLYVGIDALDIEKWRVVSNSPGTSIGVSSILLGLVLVGRAAFVFPLSFLSNLTKKSESDKIGFKQQITIWWAGLMRGAVSVALAYNQFTMSGHTQLRGNAIMITSTITIVLFSTLVFGLMTKPLISFLLPPPKYFSSMMSSEPSSPKSFSMPLLVNGQDPDIEGDSHNTPPPTNLRMLWTTPTHTVHHYWRKFDNAYMRPVFGGRGFVPYVATSLTERNAPQLQ
ncbi:Sodium/hydrogen exchanger 1 [Vitis vinifera]|uniref:Sodium/hydrogen exchanger 1 n=1 Tax=Vitis vinifera TaxID=29760 RepID=A0A438KID7_VITVI|nr:Sodium/hydrogen exchanger 1 [Vitis vinifera]